MAEIGAQGFDYAEFLGGPRSTGALGLIFENVDPAGFGAGWLEMASESAIEGAGYADHGFEGEVVVATHKAGHKGRLGPQAEGELALLNASLLHAREHFFGELKLGKLYPILCVLLCVLE
jgi:hypothetical protein